MTSRPSGFTLTGSGRLRLYSTRELLQMPAPEWLVDGIVPQGGLVGIYGQPGGGKSFVAIDLALCVATGRPWQGHAVQQGFVIYIAAEGGVGITKRVRGWLAVNDLSPDDANIAWLTESVAVNNDADDLETLFARIDDEVEQEPTLIIIDTLARCFDGNENEQEDMGRFIAGVDRMRLVYGATVIIIHHTNVSGARERGNTAFRGAADAMIAIDQNKESGTIEVSCTKQKDAADFETLELMFQLVPEHDTAVIVQAGQIKANLVLNWLKVGPLSYAELKTRAEGGDSGAAMSPATLKRKLRELRESGKIIKNVNDLYEAV